tara:strand:- start:339 stop:1247 length:909 start_codon:yes stop_codon:yes gene_type:complete
MAITVAARALAKKLLKNKSLKKAISVTSKQTNKLKNAVKVKTKKVTESAAVTGAVAKAKPAVKKAVDKTKEVSKKAVDKTKETAKKVSDKTPEGVKKAAKTVGTKTKKAAKTVGTGALGVLGAGTVAGGIVGGQMGNLAGKAIRGAGDQIRKIRKKPPRTDAKRYNDEAIDTLTGLGIGAVAGTIGTGSIVASMVKSSTPKEAEYDISRLRDGRFSTQFKDKNANVVFSAKQLNSKEVDDVRTQLAILDSIILSENPKSRRSEFTQIATYLADKYKVSNITGNNLSLIIPNVEGGVQIRGRT